MKKFLLTALFSMSSLAFAGTSHLAFKGECALYDGQTKIEIGTFSLDHEAALARLCPHTTLNFTIPGSSVAYTVYVEHQGFGEGTVYSGIYVARGDKTVGYASITDTRPLAALYLGSELAPGLLLQCSGLLTESVE